MHRLILINQTHQKSQQNTEYYQKIYKIETIDGIVNNNINKQMMKFFLKLRTPINKSTQNTYIFW